MTRREFLQRMGALGLVAAAPKIIFDYGANNYKRKWIWYPPTKPLWSDPFMRCGHYFNTIEKKWESGIAGEPDHILDQRLASREPGTYHWFDLARPNGEVELYKGDYIVKNYAIPS